MKGHAVSFIYILNIIAQALFSLLFSVAVFFGIGYLAVNSWGAPSWVYVPLILVGVGVGFVSMVKFILSAMAGLDRLEAQRRKGKK
jgi:uncharacterized membrane protein YcjF (UPF0283 family)